MKKVTETPVTEETQSFPVTLEEYLQTIKKPESRAGFAHLMRQEEIGGHKDASEWDGLFELFKTKPVSVSWQEHSEPQGGK